MSFFRSKPVLVKASSNGGNTDGTSMNVGNELKSRPSIRLNGKDSGEMMKALLSDDPLPPHLQRRLQDGKVSVLESSFSEDRQIRDSLARAVLGRQVFPSGQVQRHHHDSDKDTYILASTDADISSHHGNESEDSSASLAEPDRYLVISTQHNLLNPFPEHTAAAAQFDAEVKRHIAEYGVEPDPDYLDNESENDVETHYRSNPPLNSGIDSHQHNGQHPSTFKVLFTAEQYTQRTYYPPPRRSSHVGSLPSHQQPYTNHQLQDSPTSSQEYTGSQYNGIFQDPSQGRLKEALTLTPPDEVWKRNRAIMDEKMTRRQRVQRGRVLMATHEERLSSSHRSGASEGSNTKDSQSHRTRHHSSLALPLSQCPTNQGPHPNSNQSSQYHPHINQSTSALPNRVAADLFAAAERAKRVAEMRAATAQTRSLRLEQFNSRSGNGKHQQHTLYASKTATINDLPLSSHVSVSKSQRPNTWMRSSTEDGSAVNPIEREYECPPRQRLPSRPGSLLSPRGGLEPSGNKNKNTNNEYMIKTHPRVTLAQGSSWRNASDTHSAGPNGRMATGSPRRRRRWTHEKNASIFDAIRKSQDNDEEDNPIWADSDGSQDTIAGMLKQLTPASTLSMNRQPRRETTRNTDAISDDDTISDTDDGDDDDDDSDDGDERNNTDEDSDDVAVILRRARKVARAYKRNDISRSQRSFFSQDPNIQRALALINTQHVPVNTTPLRNSSRAEPQEADSNEEKKSTDGYLDLDLQDRIMKLLSTSSHHAVPTIPEVEPKSAITEQMEGETCLDTRSIGSPVSLTSPPVDSSSDLSGSNPIDSTTKIDPGLLNESDEPSMYTYPFTTYLYEPRAPLDICQATTKET